MEWKLEVDIWPRESVSFLRSPVLEYALNSDGNDPKERDRLMLQKRKEIIEEDYFLRKREGMGFRAQ